MAATNEILAADVLKSIARSEQMKAFVERSPEIYQALVAAARRFVTGEKREDALKAASDLSSKGYGISVEYIGENTMVREECIRAKDEFLALIRESGERGVPAAISFDLSHLGLLVDHDLAMHHVEEMAEAAKRSGSSLMISMEESAKTSAIIQLYKKLASRHSNIGITIQAHLHRSLTDLQELLEYPGSIRIVKGAYKEPTEIAMMRSEELNDRYLQMVERCVEAGHSLSIATHDETIIQAVEERDYLSLPHVEMEMLYGIRPDVSKRLKGNGRNIRLYLTYGTEWYLYLCHRLAEYPPNIYAAIADMFDPSRTKTNPY